MATNKNQEFWTLVEAATWVEKRSISPAALTTVTPANLEDLWGKLQSGAAAHFGCVDGADTAKIPPVTLTAYKMVTARTDALDRPLGAQSNGAASIWIRSKQSFSGEAVKDRCWPAGVAIAPAFQDRYFREIKNSRVLAAEIQRIWPPQGAAPQGNANYNRAKIQRLIEAEMKRTPAAPKTKEDLIKILRQNDFPHLKATSRAFVDALAAAKDAMRTTAPAWANPQPGRPRKTAL